MTIKEYVKQKSTKELKDELKILLCSIETVECFGISDLILREEIELELQNRNALQDEEVL